MADVTTGDPEQLLAMFDGLDEVVDADAAWTAAPLPTIDAVSAAVRSPSVAPQDDSYEQGWSVVPAGATVEIVVDGPDTSPSATGARSLAAMSLSAERRRYPDAPPRGTGGVGRVRGTTAQVLSAFRWES